MAHALRVSLVLLLCTAGCAARRAVSSPTHSIDHVGIAAADLAFATDFVAQRTGVTAAAGGAHPGLGTHNALMSLGDGAYLELISPLPGATLSPDFAQFAKLTTPTPVFFAVRSSDLAATRELLRARGFAVSELQAGSRVKPDGSTLRWRTFDVSGPGLAAAPFFIQWEAGSAHPSATSPQGCTLARLEASDVELSGLDKLLQALALEVPTSRSAKEGPAFRLTLRCPKGEVVFGP